MAKAKMVSKKTKDAKASKAKSAPSKGKTKAAPTVSPLAPPDFPKLPVIDGVRFATAAVGVRYAGRTDVLLVELAPGSSLAGVFTRSATRSAAVLDCQEKLGALKSPATTPIGIVVNSGNANTFTGKRGQSDVVAIAEAAAEALGTAPAQVFTSSTGVIGEPLPAALITTALPGMAADLRAKGAKRAAKAIMTTDTFPKGATATVEIDGVAVKVMGFAKGSGMIAPDMATMLGYVFTDANITPTALQAILKAGTNRSFNAITVDSDTSTSDTVLLAATGRADHKRITSARGASGQVLAEAIEAVLKDLALQIVRDGEGATKLVEVEVTGAHSASDADKVARSIANSPLVKTAIAGEDPNWGRVVMAVGKSGARADRDLLSIRFGEILVAENGWVCPTYKEEDGAAYMRQQELKITVDLGLGEGAATVWTCDLTHRYIDINADYRS